jgi:hypothetical protein
MLIAVIIAVVGQVVILLNDPFTFALPVVPIELPEVP